jgi:hypothetical protein
MNAPYVCTAPTIHGRIVSTTFPPLGDSFSERNLSTFRTAAFASPRGRGCSAGAARTEGELVPCSTEPNLLIKNHHESPVYRRLSEIIGFQNFLFYSVRSPQSFRLSFVLFGSFVVNRLFKSAFRTQHSAITLRVHSAPDFLKNLEIFDFHFQPKIRHCPDQISKSQVQTSKSAIRNPHSAIACVLRKGPCIGVYRKLSALRFSSIRIERSLFPFRWREGIRPVRLALRANLSLARQSQTSQSKIENRKSKILFPGHVQNLQIYTKLHSAIYTLTNYPLIT